MNQQLFIYQIDPRLAAPVQFDAPFYHLIGDGVGASPVQGENVIIKSQFPDAKPLLIIDNFFDYPLRRLRPEGSAEDGFGAVGAVIRAAAAGDDDGKGQRPAVRGMRFVFVPRQQVVGEEGQGVQIDQIGWRLVVNYFALFAVADARYAVQRLILLQGRQQLQDYFLALSADDDIDFRGGGYSFLR